MGPRLYTIWWESVELWSIVSFYRARVVHPICLEPNDVASSKLMFGIACTDCFISRLSLSLVFYAGLSF